MKTRDNVNQSCKEHSGVSAAPCSLIRIMPLAVTAWSITVISRSRASSPPLQLSWPHICSRAAAYIMSTTHHGSSNSWLADSNRTASNLTLEVKSAIEEARTPRDGGGSSRNLHSSPPTPPTLTPEERVARFGRLLSQKPMPLDHVKKACLAERAAGGAASLRSERSSVVVRYDSKTARVVDFTMQPESRTLPLLFSILPRARARSRSCVTLHPPSPRRGDPRADQLDDVRSLERARPPAERADPLEAGAARAGAVVEHDARDAGRAQLMPGLAAEGRAVRRAGRVADRAAVSHQCL